MRRFSRCAVIPCLAATTSHGLAQPVEMTHVRAAYNVMNPRVVFRRRYVPMMILDPRDERDHLPVIDHSER